jgi:hypothetical protein
MTRFVSSLPRRLAAGALVVNSVAIQASQWTGRVTTRQGFLLNLATLGLLAAQLPGSRSRPRPLVEGRWQLAALGLVLVLGVGARTLLLDRFPPPDGQLWEETQTGKVAFDSIRSGSLDPYFPLTNLIGEAGFRVFGRSLFGLRLAFVALSIASVPVFFIAARWLLRTPLAALLCAALFAANVFLAGAGRVALETMAPVFTVSLALAWTFRAGAELSYAAFALAGFANGLLLIEYFGYKLIPPLAFGFLALSLFQPARGAFCNVASAGYDASRVRFGVARLLVFALFAVAVVVPLVLPDPRHAADYFLEGYQRQQVGISGATAGLGLAGKLEEAFGRVAQTASFVFWRGNDNDLLPESMGIVDPATGLLGVVALAYAAGRSVRCPAKCFLALGVVSLTVLSGLLVGNPARYRLAALVPLYLLLIGVAADDLLSLHGRMRNVAAAAVATVVIAVAAWNVHLLFGRIVADRDVRLEFYDLNLLLAKRIATLQERDPKAVVFLLSDRDFLGRINDYEFLYDLARVRVAGSAAEVSGGAGYVVAHDGFIDELREVRQASDCRRDEAWLGLSRIVSCRLG